MTGVEQVRMRQLKIVTKDPNQIGAPGVKQIYTCQHNVKLPNLRGVGLIA